MSRRRLTLAQARETPCFSCTASPCCTHLPVHRFHVRTLVDLDHALYLLNFDRIELGLSPNGEWSIFYAYPCRFLDTRDPKNYLCTIHNQDLQPKICVHYNPYQCWYRRALGDDHDGEFLRIDRRRLAWIAERVELDEHRVIRSVPTWADMAAMAALLPLEAEPVDQPAPPGDPVFDAWLAETAGGPVPARPPALKVYQEFIDPCSGCSAQCCKTLVFPHGRPVSRANLDYLQFALGFPGVEVAVSDGEWQLVIKTTCRHLTDDNRCGIFGQPERPMLCRYFDASSCTYVTQFGGSPPAGSLRVQLEQLYWLTEAVRFTSDGAIAHMPPTDELRTHIERRWSETVASHAAPPAAEAPPPEASPTA